MISADYSRAGHRLTVSGHAGDGEYGRDIVCAAASILTCTLAEDMRRLCEAGPELYRLTALELEPGHAVLELWAAPEVEETAARLFDWLCGGFELLSRRYPGRVRFRRD